MVIINIIIFNTFSILLSPFYNEPQVKLLQKMADGHHSICDLTEEQQHTFTYNT